MVSEIARAERPSAELLADIAHAIGRGPRSRNSSGGSSRDEIVETFQHDSRSSGSRADYVPNVEYLSQQALALLDAVADPIPSALAPAVADGIYDLEYF